MSARHSLAALPRLIALDWGTSTLRAFLLGDDAAVLDQHAAGYGIQNLPAPGGRGGFEAAFAQVAGDWLARWPTLPVVACGMVGSAQGWKEAPYVACPADVQALAAHAVRAQATANKDLWLAPGLRFDPPEESSDDAPDVMRGEEMQIAGAMQLQPLLSARAHFVLPGTHSKWARVEAGRVLDFATFMTGELYALLCRHSILGRLMPRAEGGADGSESLDSARRAAFDRGLRAARASRPGELGHQLFAVRTLGLTGRLAPPLLGEYLSGLLIGHELICGLAMSKTAGAPLVLIGDAALTGRYVDAFAQMGVRVDAVLDNTAPQGVWSFAQAAGLLVA